jgi:hypothetical protein
MLLVNKKRVVEEIEELVASGMNYIEACTTFCQTHNLEEESLASFVKASKATGLHAKILADAKKMNMVKVK